MKTAIILSLSLLILGTLPASSAKRYSDNLYKNVISRHCRAVTQDTQLRFHTSPRHISRDTIQIRRVQSLSRGWLRIYGAGSAKGRLTQGHVDYHPRRKRVRCPDGNWTYSVYPDDFTFSSPR